MCNGYYIVSELAYVLKSGYYNNPLDYDNVDWFVNEVIKLEKKIFIKNTKKDIIMTEEDFNIKKICRFCGKETFSDKIKDSCHWLENIADLISIELH